MKLLLTIRGEPHHSPHLTVTFGKGYIFRWNEALRAYAYEPKSQRETDEIYESQAVERVWTFVPYVIPAAPIPPDEREAQAAFVAGLQRDIDSAAGTIAGLRKQNADKDGTIAMLRADLAAQQQKAAAVATPPPAKAKPGRKGQPIPPEDESDIPTD